MSIARALVVYAVAWAVFVVVDLVWIALGAQQIYAREVGALLRPDVRWLPAIAFYALFLVGLVVFAIAPGLSRGGSRRVQAAAAAWRGALYGLFTYQTYALTNLALLTGWTTTLALIDMVWGTVLAALVAVGTAALLARARP